MKGLAVWASGLVVVAGASAQLVQFDILVSGDAPSSLTPASLSIHDLGDDLELTFAGSGLTSPESIKTLWLNLPDGVSLTQTDRLGVFTDPTVSGPGSQNGFGGSYTFGWAVEFSTSGNPNVGIQRFGYNESVTFLVAHPTLSLDPVNLLNASLGDKVPLVGGIHIISLENGGSAKVGVGYDATVQVVADVPEPHEYALLFGLGALGFGLVRRHLKQVA